VSESVIQRLYQRVQGMFALGRIGATRDDRPMGSAQVRIGTEDVRDNVPMLGIYGVTSVPLAGAEALVMFLGGARSNPVVIGTGDGLHRVRNLGPGETALHNASGMIIRLTAGGITIDGGGQDISITGTPRVHLTGCDLEVSGGDVKIDGFSLRHHVHPGVQPGTGRTGQAEAP